MVSMRSGRLICTQPRLLGVSPMLPLKQFQRWSDRRWSFLVLSSKIAERFLFLHLTPPGDRWGGVLGFVLAGSVLSFSTFQIFRDASRLQWLLFPPVYLLCPIFFDSGMSRTVHTEDFSKVTHASLGFLLHFSLFVAGSLNPEF